MRLRRDLCPGRIFDACALTIGNFDGLHRGHEALLMRCRDHARERDIAMAVMTFEPLSREYFGGPDAPGRLQSAGERIAQIGRFHPDLLWMPRFGPRLAQTSPEDFIDRFLVEVLGVNVVVLGDDFRFGHRASGNLSLLREHGADKGFEVDTVSEVAAFGVRVSSTAVRAALSDSDFAQAERLLGRPYDICSRVVHGQRLGRKLGYPTANLLLKRRKPPLSGIFAVRVNGAGLSNRAAVASLGTRPTVGGGPMVLEVHVFDYDGDLYGQRLHVRFVEKLRDEEHFPDLPSLTAKMHEDAARARRILAANELTSMSATGPLQQNNEQ